jgi:glycosyltransferase involved in cell wall biosynthesis
MKLLLLSEYFPDSENACITGGVEARNYYFAKYTANDLIILASRTSYLKEKKHFFHARVEFIGSKRKYLQSGDIIRRLIYVFACIKSGMRQKYDVVEGTNWITNFAALIIGKINHKKTVFWYPDVWIGQYVKLLGIQGLLLELLERFLLSYGKNCRFIAISKSTKDKLIAHGVNSENITVIPCGVDFEELAKIQSKAKDFDLIAVNRLVDYKNTMLIVRAAVTNNFSLLVIGDGAEYGKIDAYIAENDVGTRIKIIRRIESHADLLREVSRGAIFVSASRVEGFNITVVEAAALGRPCFLSAIPAHRELCQNLKGCLNFESSEGLTRIIKKILYDRDYYLHLSRENSHAAQKYSWEKIIKTTDDYL